VKLPEHSSSLEHFIVKTETILKQPVVIIKCDTFHIFKANKKVVRWNTYCILVKDNSKANNNLALFRERNKALVLHGLYYFLCRIF
jgi:hypothetical protein